MRTDAAGTRAVPIPTPTWPSIGARVEWSTPLMPRTTLRGVVRGLYLAVDPSTPLTEEVLVQRDDGAGLDFVPFSSIRVLSPEAVPA